MPVNKFFARCLLLACLVSVSCRGGEGSSPTSPTGPGGTSPTAGVWTGTLTRPGSLGTLSLRWDVTTSAGGLTGPMTLTNGAATVTVTARGATSGNDGQGYAVFVSFNQNAGEAPATGCSVRGNSTGAMAGEPFPAPYTRITIPTFNISYSGCRGGLVDTGYSSPLSNFLQETVRLELSK
jgi:hypothetical protein